MRLLLVEDEHRISVYIKRGLEEAGFAVDLVATGRDALDYAAYTPYDLIVLDIMLPEVDGLTVCQNLRQQGNRTPILMLTARDGVEDRVKGLDAGADDYLVKPFAMKELLARLRAITRRFGDGSRSSVIEYADLSLDTRTRDVQRGGQTICLAAKEFAVLECLIREPERVLSRTQIVEHVWNYDTFNQSNIVDVYIRNLRRKIDDPFEKKLICTVRGVGYRLSMR